MKPVLPEVRGPMNTELELVRVDRGVPVHDTPTTPV